MRQVEITHKHNVSTATKVTGVRRTSGVPFCNIFTDVCTNVFGRVADDEPHDAIGVLDEGFGVVKADRWWLEQR